MNNRPITLNDEEEEGFVDSRDVCCEAQRMIWQIDCEFYLVAADAHRKYVICFVLSLQRW